MARRLRSVTDTEIRNALEEGSEDESVVESNEELDSDLSDSEVDVLETASKIEDEASCSGEEEEEDDTNMENVFVGKDATE